MEIAVIIIILLLGLSYAYCIYDQFQDEKKSR